MFYFVYKITNPYWTLSLPPYQTVVSILHKLRIHSYKNEENQENKVSLEFNKSYLKLLSLYTYFRHIRFVVTSFFHYLTMLPLGPLLTYWVALNGNWLLVWKMYICHLDKSIYTKTSSKTLFFIKNWWVEQTYNNTQNA